MFGATFGVSVGLGSVLATAEFTNPFRFAELCGGYRYINVYLEKAERIYLILFYGKNEQDDLISEQKKTVAELVTQLGKTYGE